VKCRPVANIILAGRIPKGESLKTKNIFLSHNYMDINHCDGDQHYSVVGSNHPLLEICEQGAPQPGQMPWKEYSPSQLYLGSDAVILSDHRSFLATASRGCGKEPWTSQTK